MGMPEKAVQMYADHGQAAEAGLLAAQLGLDLSRLVLSSPGHAPSIQRDMASAGDGDDLVEAAAEGCLKASTSPALLGHCIRCAQEALP